jgi:hypothetical protein
VPRLILEFSIIALIVYGIFWVFSKGTPAQNRKLLKLAARLVAGGLIAIGLAGGIAYGLIQLNHIF